MKKNQKNEFEFIAFILHINEHENTQEEHLELNQTSIQDELNWQKEKLDKHLQKAIHLKFVELDKDIIRLTKLGKDYYKSIVTKFI